MPTVCKESTLATKVGAATAAAVPLLTSDC